MSSLFLLPLAWIYDGITSLRNALFDIGLLKQRSFDVPLISVGNLAVGGTGKTPHVEYILRFLHTQGLKTGMLSRGYGRKTRGYVEGRNGRATDIGDEPFQIQSNCPFTRVCVCESRCTGIDNMLKEGERLDAIVLDDAFQHRYVKPGVSILLTEYSRPYYKDWLMPAGRLRESCRGAKRADVTIVTKCPEDLSKCEQQKMRRRLERNGKTPVFFTTTDYGELKAFTSNAFNKKASTDSLKEKRILLLCGIAHPEKFLEHFKPLCREVELAAYPDHHNFTPSELKALGQRAKDFDCVITTEKDAARLREYELPVTLIRQLMVQPIVIRFINTNEETIFNKIITDYVTSH